MLTMDEHFDIISREIFLILEIVLMWLVIWLFNIASWKIFTAWVIIAVIQIIYHFWAALREEI